jgi:group II intron reverse transcriptase/maturase
MRNADIVLDIHQKRGAKGLPLERVYRHLFDPELFLRAYGKIYCNAGAMTKGTTAETVDGMDLQRIQNIIGFLRMERYDWTPVRRTEIPKANGKKRPLGIPTWSDKLVQEVIRTLLEPYYEQRFSDHSHGFRPKRSCHSALRQIQNRWKGTVWFIEGDIKGCFDNIDHEVLLSILRRDIHDGRLVQLIRGLLKAGYMANWRYFDSLSGTPQGGILSPLLANVYLNELDMFVEDTLIPMYTRGETRRRNPEYRRIEGAMRRARKNNDLQEIEHLKRLRRTIPSNAVNDPDYRRLRYVRYADDFLLGFVGPRSEAEEIRQRISEFLDDIKLTLSLEKTLITHAHDGKAKFLGYEMTVVREGNLIASDGRRATNGKVVMLMPRTVTNKYRSLYCEGGKVFCRAGLIADTDYTILQRYQSVLAGVYNYYCMAINVARGIRDIKWILETSLLKTLACKHRTGVNKIRKMFRVVDASPAMFRVVIERTDKEPLVAIFGGIRFERKPEGLGATDFIHEAAWFRPGGNRSEIVQRLLAGKCELCGEEKPLRRVVVHHIRALADIDRPGRPPKENWERIMSARKRKSLVVCTECHYEIHAGKYDGPKL